MRIHLPHIDRKAALLAGHEIGPHPFIEAAPADFGEAWPQVVAALNLNNDGSGVLNASLPVPTIEAVAAAAKARAERAADRLTDLMADIRSATEALLNAEPVQIERHFWDDQARKLGPYAGYTVPSINVPSLYDTRNEAAGGWAGIIETPEYKAMCAAKEALGDRAKAADIAARDAAMPALIAAAEEKSRRQQQEAADAAAAKEIAIADRAAKRLETGYWESETGAYNDRRYGKPWCARVTHVDSRGKLVYEWGEWSGRYGSNGLLRVACKPGEIIAYGQKDNRKPNRSDNTLLRMRDDGRMVEISVVDAAKVLREPVAKAEN